VAVEKCREIARRGERVAIYTTDLDGSGRPRCSERGIAPQLALLLANRTDMIAAPAVEGEIANQPEPVARRI